MSEDTKANPSTPPGAEKPGGTSAGTPAAPAKPAAAAPAKPAATTPAQPAKPAAPAKPAGPAPEPWTGPLPDGLKSRFGSAIKEASTYLGQNYLLVERAYAVEVLQILRNEERFDYCVDLTAVHYPKKELQFEIVWIL